MIRMCGVQVRKGQAWTRIARQGQSLRARSHGCHWGRSRASKFFGESPAHASDALTNRIYVTPVGLPEPFLSVSSTTPDSGSFQVKLAAFFPPLILSPLRPSLPKFHFTPVSATQFLPTNHLGSGGVA